MVRGRVGTSAVGCSNEGVKRHRSCRNYQISYLTIEREARLSQNVVDCLAIPPEILIG